MNNTSANISSITSEKAKQILQANGLRVSAEQAADVVKFLTTLANATINNERSLPVHKSKHG